ncbi:RHS repeat-associated core domain-containing protein [Roseateles asaccharophilus]|uniref:RHS repeat-associated protein n=1 Tax=Roseateles asaccharophilus TaxID=582607 RepID=A0ABU2ADX4_9BURK|nr:RHS repeat-associated core domain-containing protein [Roseateles asaccharophilus]MDR7335406.1 RHS repeat-associated protein [Roseateles asaccharophilus]
MRNKTLKRQGFATSRGARWRAGLLVPLASLGVLGGLAPASAQTPADPYNYSRSVAYTYDAADRVLTETVEPDNPALCVRTTYGYDAWGNKNSTTVANCAGTIPARQQFTSRNAGSNYAPATMPVATINGTAITLARGLFPITTTNALGHTENFEYDPRFGAVTKRTDANGKVSSVTLDDFGRKTRATAVDNTSTIYRYCYIAGRVSDLTSNTAGCDSGVPAEAPADAVSYVHSEPRNTADAKMGPYGRVYFDRLGREIRSVTESFDGTGQPTGLIASLIVKDTVYSAQGSKLMETQPYFLASGSSTATGTQDVGVTLTRYDALGRPTALFTADANGLSGSYSFSRDGGAGVSYANYGSRTITATRYNYAGLSTTLINDKGQQRLDERNAIGLLVRVTDEAGGQLAHQYDAFNNLLASKDALQNLTTLQYDLRGRKTQLNDPDSGIWKYEHDPLGQLVWQENPNQRAAATAITMAYDKLGRMTSRSEPEGTGTWTYDTALSTKHGCFKGLLCASSYTRAGTGDTRTNHNGYDSVYRVFNSLTTVTNGPSMAGYNTYDGATGRLTYKTYPTGVQVNYDYTARGFLKQLKLANAATVSPLPATAGGTPGASVNLAAGSSLWQAQIVNAWGRSEQSTLGNGVTGRAGYEAATGRTVAQSAGPGASKTVLDYNYAWDSLNNLVYRADNIGDPVAGAVTENFEYGDALARLTKYTVNAPGVPGGSRTVHLQYNALGMLLSKSDVGIYTYPTAGSARPHALATLTALDNSVTTYGYDDAGNLTSASDGKYRSITYTSFNLPDSQNGITGAPGGAHGGTAQHTWVYDENRARIKEVRTITGGTQAGTRTLWYLHPDNAGGLGFEHEVNSPVTPTADNPAQTSSRHFLSVGGQAIGVLITHGSLPTLTVNQLPPNLASATIKRLEYWHKDHLGSLAATTDHAGAVTQRYAYDPFGKRRQVNGSYDAFGAIVIDWGEATNAGTNRGYTGHEHLDDVGLIHMNGRVFDPRVGLFLQPDQNIQNPDDPQNRNRYSYCLNNPLTCTDPTGMEGTYTSPVVLPSVCIGNGCGAIYDAQATHYSNVANTYIEGAAGLAQYSNQYLSQLNTLQSQFNAWSAASSTSLHASIAASNNSILQNMQAGFSAGAADLQSQLAYATALSGILAAQKARDEEQLKINKAKAIIDSLEKTRAQYLSCGQDDNVCWSSSLGAMKSLQREMQDSGISMADSERVALNALISQVSVLLGDAHSASQSGAAALIGVGPIVAGKLRNAHLAGRNHPRTGVPFDRDGYPDFSGFAVITVQIKQTGSRAGDFRAANAKAGYTTTPKDYSWHHHQDGVTMQLVPSDIHAITGHHGGFNPGAGGGSVKTPRGRGPTP